MKLTKRLNKYLIQLPILGLCFFVVMCIFAIFFFRSLEGWSIYYLPFKLASEIFGYYVITQLAQGGSVNYYFTPHKVNEDEKMLNSLIIKYSSRKLITLTVILFIAVDIFLSIYHINQMNRFQFTDVAFFMIWTVILVVLMCEGVKYLSAWWNIKKNWKKEFNNIT